MASPTSMDRRHTRLSRGQTGSLEQQTLEDRLVDPGAGAASGRTMILLGVGLFSLYWLLSLALSPNAYLSTDVGGKTAALAAMEERGDWSTDLGYWAEASDPEGLVYPYANTKLTAEGWWVNTTSLPMVLAARPLWILGGPQLILLLPMLSSVGAALVAGRLQHRLDGSSGVVATLFVGTATPVTVYALDFWEHAPGVFFMALGAWGALLAMERSTVSHALLAGLGFGFAATMRQEALVYGFCAGSVLVVASWRRWRRGDVRLVEAVAPCVSMAVAAVGLLAASTLGEILYYGEALRSGRSAGAATAATSGVGDRMASGLVMTLSPIMAVHPIAILLGATLLGGLVWLAASADHDRDLRRPAIICAVIFLALAMRVLRFGPSFVPGMIPSTTFAAAGIWFGLTRPAQRWMASLALLPVPLVFLTHYAGGAAPQWGGRYFLFTGYLLGIIGLSAAATVNRQMFRGLAVAGLAVTSMGVWFAAERTNSVQADFDLVAEIADGDVVVWFSPMTAREGGPGVLEERWLTTFGNGRIDTVIRVLDDNDVDRFVFVDRVGATQATFDGFEPTSRIGEWETSPIFDQRLTVFERS